MKIQHALCLLLLLSGFIGSCRPPAPSDKPPAGESRSVAEAMSSGETAGFARALKPRPFVFPADDGPHPEFQTEWWYYTGNLQSASDPSQQYGYQLTIFRRALSPDKPGGSDNASRSDWRSPQIYFAHFAFSDLPRQRFAAAERISRGAAGLAGATPDRVWIEDWQIQRTPTGFRLQAAQDGLSLDLEVASTKSEVLQGQQGLSPKSSTPGNASYYYSRTRLQTRGTVRWPDGQSQQVSGLSWLDREWSTSALSKDQLGWDWFSLQLDNQHELMLYQLRRKDGSVDPISAGTLIKSDGSSLPLKASDFEITVLDHWQSPATGTRYPARWQLRLPGQDLTLEVSPKMADQELRLDFSYWEGAVRFSGQYQNQPVSGEGYVELTGYNEQRK